MEASLNVMAASDIPETSRRSALEARLAALEATRLDLVRTVHRAPWLLLSALGAVPAGLVWGVGIGFAVLVTAVTVSVMAMYLAWSHEQEYAAQQDTVRQAIADLDQPGVRKSTPWRVQGKATQW